MSRPADFYGEDLKPYLGPKTGRRAGLGLCPQPQTLETSREAPPLLLSDTGETIALAAPEKTGVLDEFARALRFRFGPRPSVRSARAPEARIRFRLTEPGEGPLGGGEEAYFLRTREEAGRAVIEVESEGLCGLFHGARTAVDMLREGAGGRWLVPQVKIADAPAIRFRMLGGWALARAEGLAEAIEIAASVKANRILYNAWGWVPGERLTAEDAAFAALARERGIELVFELRRMSFGKAFDLRSSQAAEAVTGTFVEAAKSGFRSFGLLFDDVDWDPPELECRIARDAYEAVTAVLGEPPEFLVCPRYYWIPGQMDRTWSGPAGAEETRAQREYLRVYGRELPPGIHLYIANWWGGFPRDYRKGLEAFAELTGRRPVFFDNYLINDYRLGAVLPFALRGRPRDLGEAVSGYALNAPLPLSAQAPAAMTALAYAWNPRGYEPQPCLANAMHRWYGGAAQRLFPAFRTLARLASEWAGGAYSPFGHYRTIGERLARADLSAEDVASWRRRLSRTQRAVAGALRAPEHPKRPGALRGLLALAHSNLRLDADLALLELFLALHGAVRKGAMDSAEAAAQLEAAVLEVESIVLGQVASILPALPGRDLLTAGVPFLEPVDRARLPASSWVEYFFETARRELRRLGDLLRRRLEQDA